MAKVFSMQSMVTERPNRNNHDLRHKNHMTGKAGVLYPFMCTPTVPSDVFEIDIAAAFNFQSLWYPTQSNMRFIFHLFWVPKRLLQDNYKNFLQGLPDNETGSSEIERAYLDLPASFYKTGSLADYLNIPTIATLDEPMKLSVSTPPPRTDSHVNWCIFQSDFDASLSSLSERMTGESLNIFSSDSYVSGSGSVYSFYPVRLPDPVLPFSGLRDFFTLSRSGVLFSSSTSYSFSFVVLGSDDDPSGSDVSFLAGLYGHVLGLFPPVTVHGTGTDSVSFPLSRNILDSSVSPVVASIYTDSSVFYSFYYSLISRKSFKYYYLVPVCSGGPKLSSGEWFDTSVSRLFPSGSRLEISQYPQLCPYHLAAGTPGAQYNDDSVKLSALEFRAYEMVYNCYYRNHHGVQPFVLNGIEQYNNYLSNNKAGADQTEYHLFSRNWELDAYTSCMPSPMQGVQPIISVNAMGRMTLEDPDGTVSTMDMRDLPDGQKGVEIVDMHPANSEHARILMSRAASGLSIADFRQGNALTRFLEQSLRSGYRYVDFIKGHFGAAPKHSEMDMPLFLGGFTQSVDVSKVTNVSASGDVPLGDFGGSAAAFGTNKHRVKRYFDDYGFVLGIMSVVPDAAYSQILPKQYSISGRLDEYFPEFSQLGLQPITYEEVCPIQSRLLHLRDGTKLLTDTFGYQRPNHDMVWMFDEVHGEFRKSLSGSVIQRLFSQRPELNDAFLKIHPEEVNSIFTVTDPEQDVFTGQIAINLRSKRPVPVVVVPTLGR